MFMDSNKICRVKIEENIIRVQSGKELTLPLAILNKDCKFKKMWAKFAGKSEEELNKVREYNRKYYQKPEVKARHREYSREYNQRPEIKARAREYYQKVVKDKQNQQELNKLTREIKE